MQSRFLVGVVAVGLALLVGRTARAPERGIIYGFGLSQMPLGQAVVDFDAVNRLLLVSDIGETRDLSTAQPKLTRRLHERLRAWRQGLDAPMPVAKKSP